MLGIKGTLSVVELKVIRQRLLAGEESKARRGELFKRLPIGFAPDAVGKVCFTPIDGSAKRSNSCSPSFEGSGANKVWINTGLPGLPQGSFYAAASTAFQTAGILLSLRRSLPRLNPDARAIEAGEFSDHASRQYLAWSNTLTRTLRALGLAAAPAAKAPRHPSTASPTASPPTAPTAAELARTERLAQRAAQLPETLWPRR